MFSPAQLSKSEQLQFQFTEQKTQLLTGMRISVKIQPQVCLGFLLNHKEVMHKCLDKEKRVNLLEQALLHLKTQCWQFLAFHIHINHRSSHCKADLTPASYLGHQSSH